MQGEPEISAAEPAVLPFPRVKARPGRTRRNLPADEWRTRILHAARILFAERGYDDVPMDEIARTAGISRARLYTLYAGRRELFDAIIEQDAQSLAGEVVLALARATTTTAKVRALVDVFFRFVESRHERHRVLYSHAGLNDPALAEMMRTVRGALAETLAQQLVGASDEAPPVEPAAMRLMSHAIIAMAEGAATAWVSGPRLDRDHSIDIVSEVALRALGMGGSGGGV